MAASLRRPRVTEDDVKDPVRLQHKLDRAYEELVELHRKYGELRAALKAQTERESSRLTLSGSDRALLDQLALIGVDELITSEKQGIVTVSALPAAAIAFQNQTVRLESDGQIYTFSEETRQWEGFRTPPRMTTAERDAIVSPIVGMLIYNTTTNVMNFYNGTVWGPV